MGNLNSVYLKIDSFRLYPNKEEKKRIEKEFYFEKRIYAHLVKVVLAKFQKRRGELIRIEPSKIRPLVFGILKKYKDKTKYDFSKYLAEDHFSYAAKKIFHNYEKKVGYGTNVLNRVKFKESILISPSNITFNYESVNLLSCKIKIRPKNESFNKYKWIYIVKMCGNYYVHCCYFKRKEIIQHKSLACGIDTGIRTNLTIVDSDGNVEKINFNLDKVRLKIRKAIFYNKLIEQNKSKNGNIESKNVAKLRHKVTKCYIDIHNYRTYLYNNIADYICRKYKYICIEGLNAEEFYKFHTLKTEHNILAIAQFYEALEKKSSKYGCSLCKADRFFQSSQICSNCGVVHNDMRSFEVFKDRMVCECGLDMDRDENAAKNLLDYMYKKLDLNKELVKPIKERYEQLSLFDI